MQLVFIGLFLFGICMSATAAVYVPKKKNAGQDIRSPKVKTFVKLGEKNDAF